MRHAQILSSNHSRTIALIEVLQPCEHSADDKGPVEAVEPCCSHRLDASGGCFVPFHTEWAGPRPGRPAAHSLRSLAKKGSSLMKGNTTNFPQDCLH